MTTRQLAARYVEEQLEIIRKHGGKPKLSADKRRTVVASVERTFEAMRERRRHSTNPSNRPAHA